MKHWILRTPHFLENFHIHFSSPRINIFPSLKRDQGLSYSLYVKDAYYFPDPPQVALHLGNTLNPEDIKEGDDVYFECNIKANPKQHKISWYHDVSTSS